MIIDEERSVRFDIHAQVFLIAGRDDITLEERMASFFTDDENSCIREREKRLARDFSRTGAIDDYDEDVLGLELKEDKLKRRQRIRSGQMSVVLEQELQWDANERDIYFIEEAYAPFARESARLAYHRGLSNAEQVQSKSVALVSSKSCVDSIRALVPHRWVCNSNDQALLPMCPPRLPYPPPHQAFENRPPQPWDQWTQHLSEVTAKRARWYFSE